MVKSHLLYRLSYRTTWSLTTECKILQSESVDGKLGSFYSTTSSIRIFARVYCEFGSRGIS